MPHNPDAAVAWHAFRQHGNVTRQQLIRAGLDDKAIAWRVRKGRLFPVHRGVYAVGRPPRLPIERAAAAVLACSPDAALSHLGALALWGWAKTWPDTLDVTVVTDRRPKTVTTHRVSNLLPRDTTVQLGIAVTSPARTALDCAPLIEPKQRTRTINDALRGPYLTHAHLADVRARFPNHPGAKLLDQFLDGRNPTRSRFEDDFVQFCQQHRLPRPLINVEVAGHTVDALFPEQKLIVELDGWDFHKDRDAFETDRARDGDTLRAGFPTRRITWDRLHDQPDAEAQLLDDLLRRLT